MDRHPKTETTQRAAGLRRMVGEATRFKPGPDRGPGAGFRSFAFLIVATMVSAASLGLAGCAPTVIKHGHQFQDGEEQKVQTGMSPDQVKSVLGSPTTTAGVHGGQAFYYISSVEKQTAFFKPEETDRKVLAVYFSQMGAVERVAQYGLKDGKVINFSKSETPNPARDESVLKSLFRNLGSKQLYGND